MFEINGKNFSLEQLQQAANAQNMEFDSYLQKMKQQGLVEKQAGSTGDPTMSQNNMGSQLDSGSSESVSWFDQTWFGRGIKAASTTGEATDLMSENFSNISAESIQEFMKAKEGEAKTYVESERMKKFQKQYVEEGKTWSAFFRGVRKQPGLLPELFVQSLGTQVGTLIDSPGASLAAASTGAAAGGVIGAVPGAVAGFMGGLATSMEAALTFGELIETRLKEKNQEFTDENIKALLESEGREIRNRALGRGLAIGAIEGFSGGLAGKAAVATKGAVQATRAGKLGKTGILAASASGVAVEAVGGATGEVVGRVIAGQEMDAAEIGFEAITGTVTAPINVLTALKSAKQPTYRLNGEKVTYNQMKDFVDTADDIDVAKADIQMRDDYTGLGNKAKAKQEAAEKMIELSGDVATQQEVKKAKDLNKIAATIELAKQGKQIGNVKDAFAVENNEEATAAFKKLQDQYGKDVIKDQDVTDADGFFVPTPDGNVIIINKEIAAKTGQINVGGHELLHGIVQEHYNSLGDGSEAQIKFIEDFKGTISKESLDYIQNIIDARNKDRVDKKTGKTIKGEGITSYSDEYLTIYSDGIVKKQISYNEGIFTKFKNFLQNIFRKFGYNKEFGSGTATYNFMRDYNKNIMEFNKISQRALDVAGTKAVAGDASLSVSGFDQNEVAEDLGLKETTAGIVARNTEIENTILEEGIKDKEGNIKASPAQQRKLAENNLPRAFALAKQAAGRAKDLTLDDALKIDDVMEFYSEYSLKLTELARTYKAQMTDPKTGKIVKVPFGAYMNSLLPLKYSGILDKLKSKVQTTSLSDEATARKAKNIEDTVDETNKTKGTKTKLKQRTSRKLTSLANLDIESSPLVKRATKVQLKKLIESNPKNLVEKIQEVLIPDLVEIIRQEMGVVGQKDGKLNIPDDYNAYLSDTYQLTISSMEISKVRANYKDLFTKEKMGFADYATKKSDKPSLKKDSNYIKDINRNTTTKAEFIKYHTEGKKNKLINNQRNLAIMRAEAEAVRAAENYIIDNSENLNEVYAAELRNYIDAQTVQKQKTEDKSFDSVKFSKTMYTGVTGIRDAVLTAQDVFDNNGNLLPAYQNIAGTIEDSKAAGDFIWNNLSLLNPDSDFKFIRKAYETLYKEGKRGTAYETNLIQTAIALENIYGKENIEVLLKKPTESDALPDMILRIGGEVMNIEAKMALAQYSSVTNAIVDGSMVIKKEYSPEFMKILVKLQKESQKGIKRAQDFLKSQKPPIAFDNIKEISQEGHNLLKNNIDPTTKKSYFNGMSATLPLPLKFISEIYNNKKHPVFLMQLMGRGLFSMGGDNFNLGIPALEDGGDGFITLRVGSNSKKRVATEADVKAKRVTSIYTDGTNTKKKGEKKTKRQVKTDMRSYSFRSIPGISDKVLSDMKSERNIESVAGLKKLLDSDEFKRLKAENEAKSKTRLSKSINVSRTVNDPKGITVLDFDDTLATTKSLVKFTTPEGETGTLNAEEYASTYEDLLDKGYTFDFSDFNKVVKGKLAPLFNKAIKLQGKFGPENMFVLTARPPAAQKAIFDFLKANGLNIPIKNITGLGNSTAEAKALWVADKVGEGFNDFYFADDALQNTQAVQNMLDQFDVKSKVQQAKVKFSKSMNTDFNNILEEVTGIDAVKRFSDIKARKRGESKGKFRVFIPPSHEDFVGLLYNFMGKGRKGDQHRNFFEQALVRPLNRAYREIDTAKQAIANDYKSLNKQFPNVKDKLIKNTPDGDFTFQDAIRVYLWNKHGYKIPGLTPTDQQNLVDVVMNDSELRSYAETLNTISKQEKYVDPGQSWEAGNIRIDLIDATGRVGRKEYFTEFNENAEVMFSTENLNKIEAAYGKDFREALEDMLHRIKTGVNRPKGSSAKPNMFMNWLNASVSGVMFFNTRSAILQQMSNVNFLNFADNNIFAAGKAFANQPQYWKDFAMIFNSDMLKQRRGGLGTDINGAELAEAIKKARPDNMFDQVSIIVGKALKLGFLPTQIGDNIAIATGGAAFYRNRVNKNIKDGMSIKEAEAAAFTDLQNITQSTQQSARPDMTSQQQASWIGKLVLNFLNTPSQYNRIIKKAGSDIINRRITPPNTTQMQSDMSNTSRILYYGAAQNLIFYGLQTALFAVMFGMDNDDEEKRAEQVLKKKERVINGSIDTILRGSGIYGVAVSTLKNMVIKFLEQRDPTKYNKDESAVLMELANFSPVLGIKFRRIVNAEKTLNYNVGVMNEMETFDVDNPQWSAATNYIQALTTAPVNKMYQKSINLRNAADNDYTALQRALFFSGYTTWSLNLGDTEKMEDIKESVKSKKKSKGKTNTRSRTRSRTRTR